MDHKHVNLHCKWSTVVHIESFMYKSHIKVFTVGFVAWLLNRLLRTQLAQFITEEMLRYACAKRCASHVTRRTTASCRRRKKRAAKSNDVIGRLLLGFEMCMFCMYHETVKLQWNLTKKGVELNERWNGNTSRTLLIIYSSLFVHLKTV